MYELSKQIDFTLNMSLCIRDPNFSQHVYKIEPVYTKQEICSLSFKKNSETIFDLIYFLRSMYGFHQKDELFLKIFIFNPDFIKK